MSPSTRYSMSSRLTKKSLVSVPGFRVNTPCFEPRDIRAEHAQPAHQHRHLGSRERQQLRAVDEQRLGRYGEACLLVIAESIGHRFECGEGIHIGLRLRCIHAARREAHLHFESGLPSQPLRCLRIRRARSGRPAKPFGHPFATLGLLVERRLDSLERREHLCELRRLIHFPVLLRGEPDARAIRATALVGAAERGGRGPGRRDQLGRPTASTRGCFLRAAISLSPISL